VLGSSLALVLKMVMCNIMFLQLSGTVFQHLIVCEVFIILISSTVRIITHPRQNTIANKSYYSRKEIHTKILHTYQNQHTVVQEKILFHCDSTAITATKMLIINMYVNITKLHFEMRIDYSCVTRISTKFKN
jgi:hypothetical protein